MMRAVEVLGCDPHEVLVDGNRLPRWPYRARAVVGGDALHPCISAASIIAKQPRPRIMVAAARALPAFCWDRNLGYGTPQHLAALRPPGSAPLTRPGFGPLHAPSGLKRSGAGN